MQEAEQEKEFSGYCNDLPAGQNRLLVGTASERYEGSVCGPVVEETFLPPPSQVDPSLSPWQPPGRVQAVLEGRLADALSELPRAFSPSCLSSLTSLYCLSTFPIPLQAGVWKMSLTYPSLPHRSLCLEVVASCGGSLFALHPDWALNCNSTTSAALHVFPDQEEVAVVLQKEEEEIVIASQPYQLSNHSSTLFTISPQCPEGYAVVDATEGRTDAAEATVCAPACPSLPYTSSELNAIYRVDGASALVAFLFFALQIVNIAMMKVSKFNPFLLLAMVTVVLGEVLQAVQIMAVLLFHRPAPYCRSETDYVSKSDLLSGRGHPLDVLCVLTALCSLWLRIFSWAVGLILCTDLWLCVTWRMKKGTTMRLIQSIHYSICSSAFLALALVVTLSREGDVDTSGLYCRWTIAAQEQEKEGEVWQDCIFRYFVNEEDADYREQCGSESEEVLSPEAVCWPHFVHTMLASLVIWMFTLNKEVRANWINLSLTALGVRGAFTKYQVDSTEMAAAIYRKREDGSMDCGGVSNLLFCCSCGYYPINRGGEDSANAIQIASQFRPSLFRASLLSSLARKLDFFCFPSASSTAIDSSKGNKHIKRVQVLPGQDCSNVHSASSSPFRPFGASTTHRLFFRESFQMTIEDPLPGRGDLSEEGTDRYELKKIAHVFVEEEGKEEEDKDEGGCRRGEEGLPAGSMSRSRSRSTRDLLVRARAPTSCLHALVEELSSIQMD
eukprot:scaffold5939_cov165-Ochromonas_danica.AAC.13